MKDILNPVRVLYVEDWMKLSELMYPEDIGTNGGIEGGALNLTQRYESLLKEKLTKENVAQFITGGKVEIIEGDRTEIYIEDVGLFVEGVDTFAEIVNQCNKRKFTGLEWSQAAINRITG